MTEDTPGDDPSTDDSSADEQPINTELDSNLDDGGLTGDSGEDRRILSRLKRYLNWGLGIFVGLMGLGALSGGGTGVLAAVVFVGVASLIIPPTRERIFDTIDYEMSRRAFIGILVVGLLVGGALAPDTTDNSNEGVSGESDDVAEADNQPATSDNANAGSDDTNVDGVAVRVVYSGAWSGSLSTDSGMSRSIDGEGTGVIPIDEDDIDLVSANAQKQDQSSEELTIQILHNGDVVGETSTTAEFGVAQVTAEIDDGWFARGSRSLAL